jgi:hypothetical protein
MTADELKILKKIQKNQKNLSHYQMHYYGSDNNKRDEVFKLLKQLIKGGATEPTQPTPRQREFNRGYRTALKSARLSVEYLAHQLAEMDVPPLAWKGEDE